MGIVLSAIVSQCRASCALLWALVYSPQGQPSDKTLCKQQGFKKARKMTPVHVLCLTLTSEPQSIFLGVRASFTSQEKLRPCLLSPESPLTQGGWPPPCLVVGLCFAMSRGPQKSSFFLFFFFPYHGHHDGRPSSLRRARMGQRPKLWCTRNGLDGGRPDRVATQQAVHPYERVHILHLREDALYAYPNVP